MLTNRRKKPILATIAIFFALFFIVLNPYSIYGKPGQIIAFLFASYAVFNGIKTVLWQKVILPFILLFFISTVGLVSSLVNGILQFNHVLLIISSIVLALSMQGIWMVSHRNGIFFNSIIKMLLLVVFINCLIIIFELLFDNLRIGIEAFLDPLEKGSINYAEGYRFRGLASAGGANLSIIVPAGLVLALYLYGKKELGMLSLVVVCSVLMFSVTVIGRTGLIFAFIPIAFYCFFNIKKLSAKMFASLLLILMLAITSFFIFQNFGVDLLSDRFGDDFLFYSFGFIFEGREGFQDEGTVALLAEFLKVFPDDFYSAMFGYGFFGGSDFTPWTDSGYARMFLSVGYIFGVISYFTIYRLYFSAKSIDKFFAYSFITILALAEIKETLLFSGYASRLFIIAIVFNLLERARFASSASDHRS